MITHDRFLEFAAVKIDFPLAQNEREALERHLATCSACRAEAVALRADAQAIVNLPPRRLDPERADQILGNALVRKARRPNLRLVALAALIALAALGALAVGAQLLRQSEKPPLAVIPPPSIAPSNVPAVPSGQLGPWTFDMPAEAATSLDGLAVALAESNGRLVAIGQPVCTNESETGDAQCVAAVRRSVDGLTWTPVRSAAFEFNEIFPTSGPQIGMLDIAGGPAGFVVIGYDGAEQLRVAVWTSPDGELWEYQPSSGVFAEARINAVAAGGPGWVIVGSVHRADGPRGAIWTSQDGRIWSRVADSPVFDVGGYFDTLEEPSSGSLRHLVADGDVIVAVGDICDDQGRECRAATWRSADGGATWRRAVGPDAAGALTDVIATGEGFVAFGRQCATEPPCVITLASSGDGTSWVSKPSLALPADAEVLAAVEVGGGIVAVSSRENGLIAMATRDGTTWEVLHEQVFQASTDLSPPPGYASLGALDGVSTATGGAILVGFMQIESDPEPFTPLVIHVDAASP